MGSVEVPKKHKACVYDKPGSISTKIEEIDTAEPGNGEVLVNLYALTRIYPWLIWFTWSRSALDIIPFLQNA